MTAGAVLDPATDMRLKHNKVRNEPPLPGTVLALRISKGAAASPRWVGSYVTVGTLWIELPPQMEAL
jgi:hypothetical protein